MTAMSRITLDLPARTPVSTLARWAEEEGCRLFRRPDGTFCFRPNNPTLRPVPALDKREVAA